MAGHKNSSNVILTALSLFPALSNQGPKFKLRKNKPKSSPVGLGEAYVQPTCDELKVNLEVMDPDLTYYLHAYS